jgi:DNA-binding beta-propeller fold protein YncE
MNNVVGIVYEYTIRKRFSHMNEKNTLIRSKYIFPVICVSIALLITLFYSNSAHSAADSTTAPSVQLVGTFPCGVQPKQIMFTPDSRYVYIPLLEGNGFQIFDITAKKIKLCDYPAEYAKERYFVEGLFIKRNGKWTFLVSQLTKASILEYDVSDFGNPVFIRAFKTGGSWPKMITYCEKLNVVAVSNWTSNSVAILNYETGKVITRIKNSPVPRGIIFTQDGKYLLIASFEGGIVERIDTATWKQSGRVLRKNGAMRHIVLTPDGKKCDVSNMMHNEVLEISIDPFKLDYTYKVGEKPNTIDLTSNGKYLFVSDRGPNNPKGYTIKSLIPGDVRIFDTAAHTLVKTIPGGTQPTGLDISPDDKMFASTNFQDDNFSLFELTGFSK